MALASLTVDLSLGLARFEADSGRAISAAEQLGRKIGSSIKLGAEAAVGFGAAFATASAGRA